MDNIRHETFQMTNDSIIVRYDLVDEMHGITVRIVSIQSERGKSLPYKDYTGIEISNGRYRLFWVSKAKENEQPIEVHNYYDDLLSNTIAEYLGNKREEATPRFGDWK